MSYIDELNQRLHLKRLARCQGWRTGAFVLGSSIYTPEGIHEVWDRPHVTFSPAAVARWLELTDCFSGKGTYAHALTILLSFAAPLAPLAGVGGLTAAFYGPGGYGKRCLARFALSVWSDPAEAIKAGTPETDRLAQYKRAGSLPIVHFGAVAMTRFGIDSMINEYALDPAAGFLLAPLTNELARESMQASAFDYPLPFVEFPSAEMDSFSAKHYGVVAQPYAMHLACNVTPVRALLEQAESVLALKTGIHLRHRYLVKMLACLAVAGTLTERLKLLPFSAVKAISLATQRAIQLDKLMNKVVPIAARKVLASGKKSRATYAKARRKRLRLAELAKNAEKRAAKRR